MLPVVAPMQPSKLSKDRQFVVKHPEDHVYEHKLDGWRCLAYLENGKVTLRTKSGKPLTRFPHIEAALKTRGLDEAIFDGEIVCFDPAGNPDFFGIHSSRSKACYMVFDVLWLKVAGDEAVDLRPLPLRQRKDFLGLALHGAGERLRPLAYFEAGNAGQLLSLITARGWEGVVAKRADSPYDAKLKDAWVKIYNPGYIPVIVERKKIFDRNR